MWSEITHSTNLLPVSLHKGGEPKPVSRNVVITKLRDIDVTKEQRCKAEIKWSFLEEKSKHSIKYTL
jgi:hypothetical protein